MKNKIDPRMEPCGTLQMNRIFSAIINFLQ